MTTQVHDHSMPEAGQRATIPVAGGGAARQARRPRWLLPGLVAAIVVTGLVIAGVLSLSAVLSIGVFGGMMLMHGGGHGGHGGSGGHGGHGGGKTPDAGDLSHRSHASQPVPSGSAAGLDDRATNDLQASETHDHDQHSSHGCH